MVYTRRLRQIVSGLALALLLALQGVLPAVAYSGSGQGTAQDPYEVATCQQLQEINNDLSAHYKQVADIDCAGSASWNSGAGFIPLGTFGARFSGTFDGQGFKIKNVYINTDSTVVTGLFGVVRDAVIRNIHLEGGSISTDAANNFNYMGGIVANATRTTLSDCSSTAAVHGMWGGGLVGVVYDNSTVARCSYAGALNMSGSRYAGGIIGLTEDSTLHDLYTTGALTARGGIAGVVGTGTTVYNVYSSAAVSYNDVDEGGGLFGSIDGFFTPTQAHDIFFDGTVNAPSASSVGAAIGSLEDNASVSNVYFNQQGCGCGGGIGITSSGGVGTATAVNPDGNAASYFKGNSTNAPLHTWDFDGVWKVNHGGHPTFRITGAIEDGDGDGPLDSIEAAGPNGGDVNNDGTADRLQTNVTTFVNPVSNRYAALASSCLSNADAGVGAQTASDTAFSYPLGLMHFTLQCNSPGATATVTEYYFYATDPGVLVARKYNSTTGTYQAIPGAAITKTTVGGQTVAQLRYTITDGGPMDEDGAANGFIVDPSGLAVPRVGAPNTGLGGTFRKP